MDNKTYLEGALDVLHQEDRDRIRFIIEMDKMKTIYRQTLLLDQSRTETDAEHSWHLAMLALVLEPHFPEGIDKDKVIRMCLVHDIVEIDAGDTFAYDKEGYKTKAIREEKAADRIYKLLPGEEGQRLRAYWEEFEEGQTSEAKVANSLDRFQPLLAHAYTGGVNWKSHKVVAEDVLVRMEPIRQNLPDLWPMVEELVKRGKERDLLL